MKKNILLCGKNSYVGGKLIDTLSDKFNFKELDMRTPEWKEYDYSPFDTIIFLEAIVHRPELQDSQLYKEVNEVLPVKVAERAVKQGLKQFIFFSTMGVYGLKPSLTGNGKVSIDTTYHPKNLYGKSKLNAEMLLVELQKKNDFVLSIVRPPNIYGNDCPGNYHNYMNLCAKYMILFPLLRHNQFSMIHINNLSTVIGELIGAKASVLLCPQDPGDKSNALRIEKIAKEMNRLHYQSIFLGKLLYTFYKMFPLKQITNLFGDMYYDDTLSQPTPIDDIHYPTIIKY